MSIIINSASFVESVLVIKVLNVVMSMVEVSTSPEKSNLPPPTASLTHYFPFLWGL
jgi:hypothetical protein